MGKYGDYYSEQCRGRKEPVPELMDDEPEDDSPFCECQLEAMEDEDASNQCAACGKPLR